MSQYENFAYIYDELMSDVDYKKWADFIIRQFNKHDLPISMIAELGCGTGTMTQLLAQAGYEMIGIDLSEDMLMVAREKTNELDLDILFLQQDMTRFELYGTVDAIVATCDSLNYVSAEELLKVFKLVNNYLNPNGMFIFDLNTEYKFKDTYNNKTFTEVGEDFAYIWENHYDDQDKSNEYNITFFVEEEDGTYMRFDEFHIEYVHHLEMIKSYLEQCGLTLVKVYDDYSLESSHEKTERMTFVVTKK